MRPHGRGSAPPETQGPVDKAANDGATPLFTAAAKSHTDAMQLLLRHGAQANLVRADGCTALMYAAEYGHAGAVKLLLPHMTMAAVNHQNNDGFTALHKAVACDDGHPAVIELLVCHGADTMIKRQTTASQHCSGQLATEPPPLCPHPRFARSPPAAPALEPLSAPAACTAAPWSARSTNFCRGRRRRNEQRLTYPPPFNLAALTLVSSSLPALHPGDRAEPGPGRAGNRADGGAADVPGAGPGHAGGSGRRPAPGAHLCQRNDRHRLVFAGPSAAASDLAARHRSGLRLRRWEVGDRVEVCGLKSASALNGRMATW